MVKVYAKVSRPTTTSHTVYVGRATPYRSSYLTIGEEIGIGVGFVALVGVLALCRYLLGWRSGDSDHVILYNDRDELEIELEVETEPPRQQGVTDAGFGSSNPGVPTYPAAGAPIPGVAPYGASGHPNAIPRPGCPTAFAATAPSYPPPYNQL